MILERLGKCEEALSVIRGPLGGITTLWKYNIKGFRLLVTLKGLLTK